MYRSLNPTAIVATIEQLNRRIEERFPEYLPGDRRG